MYSLAQNGYTHEEVLQMLSGDRTISFEYDVFDKDDLLVGKLGSATATVEFDSTCEIMGTVSASFVYEDFLDGLSDWRLRPVFKLLAPRGWLSYPLGVFIMSTPQISGDNGILYCQATGYDYGIVLQEDKATERFYVEAGSNYVQTVSALLVSSGIKRMNIYPSGLTTNYDMEWEIGTPIIAIINDMLSAINYEPIHFDRNGYARSSPYIPPESKQAEYYYLANEKSLIKSGTTQTNDGFDKANVFVRYTNNPDGEELVSQYVNEIPGNPLSVQARGRRIVDVNSVDDIADQATLDALTKRIAIEQSQIYETVGLPTALMPHHFYRDCLYISDDAMNIGNRYIEYAWEMPLTVGGTMKHTVKKVVRI